MLERQPIIYLPHGGGPLPLLGDLGHLRLRTFLQTLGAGLKPPKAILVISAHWETDTPSLLAAPNPSMLYDYFGFPADAYQWKYPAPGQPELAQRIRNRLAQQGWEAVLDVERGFDHGLYIPLMLMFPQANIPCLQLSLLNSLDPGAHLRLGDGLTDLREQGVLILGSGMSFHNLKALFRADTQAEAHNQSFDRWLIDTCCSKDWSDQQRQDRLQAWEQVPGARYCHPREEHLLPLHVCFAAAGRSRAEVVFHDHVMTQKALALQWN